MGGSAGHSDIASQIERALNLVQNGGGIDDLVQEVGTSVAADESIPAAFGVVMLAKGDVWKSVQLAANIGDDTDTIGAIAGAMAGACGSTAPPEKVAFLQAANELAIDALVDGLLQVRAQSGVLK